MIQAFLDLRALQKTFDAGTGVLEQSLGAPVCNRGCGRCCECNTPLASVIEGINLVSVNMMDEAKIKRLVQTAEGWLLEPHGNKVFKGVPVGQQSGEILDEWTRTQLQQCPYLLENKDCMLHQDRPLVCRAYGVFRDTAGFCPRPLGNGETDTKHAIIDSSQVRPLVKEFFDDCRRRQPLWAIRCFLPTVIFRAASPKKFKEYVEERKIASVKLWGMDIDSSLMWQPQLDMLRKGMTPARIVMQETIHGISS